jgi:proteasome alpha subunit
MGYSFYDWNNALQQRNEYVADRLKDGSPVVAVSFPGGILMLTLRGNQRKVFEIYDRLMMGALGKQSDIESLRLAAIDSAHKEGFERSPDDVSIQRMVGFGLSPAIKRVYNDQGSIPLTLRSIFAELGRTPAEDHLFVLGFDGEFKTLTQVAVAGGTTYAEEQGESALKESSPTTLAEALKAALTAWGIARSQLSPKQESEDDDFDPLRDRLSDAPKVSNDPAVALREALKNNAVLEAALLQRDTRRESKFRPLTAAEIEPVLADYR